MFLPYYLGREAGCFREEVCTVLVLCVCFLTQGGWIFVEVAVLRRRLSRFSTTCVRIFGQGRWAYLVSKHTKAVHVVR